MNSGTRQQTFVISNLRDNGGRTDNGAIDNVVSMSGCVMQKLRQIDNNTLEVVLTSLCIAAFSSFEAYMETDGYYIDLV